MAWSRGVECGAATEWHGRVMSRDEALGDYKAEVEPTQSEERYGEQEQQGWLTADMYVERRLLAAAL